MKRTLQVVIAALALASVSVTAQAQGGGGGGPGRGGAAQRAALFEGITLTADQQIKIDTVYAQAMAKNAELRKDMVQGTPPSDELRAKMTAVTTDRNKAIKAILTADQNAMFDKNAEKAAAAAAARRPPPSL